MKNTTIQTKKKICRIVDHTILDYDDEGNAFSPIEPIVNCFTDSLSSSSSLDSYDSDEKEFLVENVNDVRCTSRMDFLKRYHSSSNESLESVRDELCEEVQSVLQPLRSAFRSSHINGDSKTQLQYSIQQLNVDNTEKFYSHVLETTNALSYEWYTKFSEFQKFIEEFFWFRSYPVLEIGCGISLVCENLVFMGYSSVIGIDTNQTALKINQLRSDGIDQFLVYKQMSALKLSFCDKYFEYMFVKATFDCLYSRSKLLVALLEVDRCLKHGGILLVVSCRQETESSLCWWTGKKPVANFLRSKFWKIAHHYIGIPQGNLLCHSRPLSLLVFKKKESKVETCLKVRERIHLSTAMNESFEITETCQILRSMERRRQDNQRREFNKMVHEDTLSMIFNSKDRYDLEKNIREVWRKERRKEDEEIVFMEIEDDYSLCMEKYRIFVQSQATDIVSDILEYVTELLDQNEKIALHKEAMECIDCIVMVLLTSVFAVVEDKCHTAMEVEHVMNFMIEHLLEQDSLRA